MNDKVEINGILYKTQFDRTGDYPFIVFNCERKYFKFCNGCEKIQLYGLKTDLIKRIKNNSICLDCRISKGWHHPMSGKHHTEETKKLLSIKRLGYQISDAARKKISEKAKLRFSIKENHPMYGRTHNKHSKEVMSEKGKIRMSNPLKNPMYGKHHSVQTKLQLSKYTTKRHLMEKEHPSKRPEVKQKMRESLLRRIRLLGNGGYNPNACKYFDALNKQREWNLQHALNGGEIPIIGYSLDAYDKKRNIVVEYDEPKHYKITGELKDKDAKRMNEIINKLGCEFYRYNEKINLLNKIN